jgi:hypothetical protein
MTAKAVFSESLGTETLQEKSMVPDSFRDPPETFSSAKKLVTQSATARVTDIMEAIECLKAW